jgi:uncharacterized protein (DUF2141 family)
MLKRLLLASALSAAVLASTANAQTAQTADCPSVEVTGLQANAGTLQFIVYGSAESFFKKPVFVSKTEVKGETARVPMCGVDAKEIAIAAFQDLNGNDKLDMNVLGIPSEPYSASGSSVVVKF